MIVKPDFDLNYFLKFTEASVFWGTKIKKNVIVIEKNPKYKQIMQAFFKQNT